jgi:hypothetical protein
LAGAGRDEFGRVSGEAAEHRRAGEHGETGQEYPAAGQQVSDTSAEQQAPTGHHQVGGDEPLQVAAAQVQGPSDRWQRGVDDGYVEHDEDLRGQGHGQHPPRLAWAVGLDVVRGVDLGLVVRGDV